MLGGERVPCLSSCFVNQVVSIGGSFIASHRLGLAADFAHKLSLGEVLDSTSCFCNRVYLPVSASTRHHVCQW